MNCAPLVTLRIPFGGDNHFDYGLQRETAGTVAGVGQLSLLLNKLTNTVWVSARRLRCSTPLVGRCASEASPDASTGHITTRAC